MVSTDDRTFKLAVLAAAVALIVGVGALRFCRDVSLPPKPPPPRNDVPADQLLASTDASPRAWRGYLEHDAAAAGLPTPDPAAFARRLAYRMDDTPRTVQPGSPPFEAAGLKLSVQVSRGDGGDDILVLAIENPGDSDVAYRVLTRPSGGTQLCHGRSILPYNAMVVGRRATERRSECSYRKGLELRIDRVEAIDLAPLPAIYVSRVPPAAVGIEPRLALGHRPKLPGGTTVCAVVASRSIAGGLENGSLAWRDLVDFYARHRCDTYGFPEPYRAFTRDNERPLPVVR